MGKTYKIGTMTSEQIIKSERNARRQADIDLGIDNFKHKVHKSLKTYNRNDNKRIRFDDAF